MIQNPPRAKLPIDPGPVGGAPGHLGRVRWGGVLLLLAIGARLLGTVVLIAAVDDPGVLGVFPGVFSSLLFVVTGLVALSRPGRLLPRGWAPVALAGLLAAELSVVLGSAALVLGLEQSAGLLLLAAHPGAMAVAAGGLLGHIRSLLRPGASMRTLSAFILVVVVAFLALWSLLGALGMATGRDGYFGLMVLTMLPLPIMATATSLVMMAQSGLPRLRAVVAVRTGLGAAGCRLLLDEPLPDGRYFLATRDGREVSVRVDDARLPLGVTVSAQLPAALSGLRITQRSARSHAPKLGDMVIDQLVAVEGMDPDAAAVLFSSEHSTLLSIIHGRPGSGVYDGAVHLRAAIGPGLRILPGSVSRQERELTALIERSVAEVSALVALLERAPEAQAQAQAQRPRVPQGQLT